jgi:hypothetical protein
MGRAQMGLVQADDEWVAVLNYGLQFGKRFRKQFMFVRMRSTKDG